jgi:high affinity Mn2+ porin
MSDTFAARLPLFRLASLLGALPLLALAPARAADEVAQESASVHGQFTTVIQRHGRFNSGYEGANSLHAVEGSKTTMDATLYLGWRPWSGGELYLNPEFDRGFGLSDTLGVAGFTSGEAYKVGHHSAYGRLHRAFLRQVLALGESESAVEAAANQLGGKRADDNLTLTVGKFSVGDLFDANSYAHDPRADFLNWSVIDAGAFDYAADSWGFSLGAAAEWNQGDWTLRGGLFSLSREPNSTRLDRSFAQHQGVIEGEHRHRWGERPGKFKLLAFASHGRMGRYDEAVALAQAGGVPADTAAVRRVANKSGLSVNLEQEVADGVGVFARWSRNDGKTEAYDFSDINRSLSLGLSLNGRLWGQPDHTAGFAWVSNGLSSPARAYFAAGGLGILIGDGRLPRYGSEQITEAYYALRLVEGLSLGLDWQQVRHPAYNPERGPVTVLGARVHAEF